MFRNILTYLFIALLMSCSSDSTLHDIEEIPASNDPLRFTSIADDSHTSRAGSSSPLTSGFMVSTYKNYGVSESQFTVMDAYEVLYITTGTAWDGNNRAYWDYRGVPGQHECFWDYSNYPYRFNAIAPCPADRSGFVLKDKQLKIPVSFEYQTCHSGNVYPANDVAEPFMLAQVQRGTDGKDKDVIVNKAINESSTTLNRDVWLPFHHLNSKIRFGIYHNTSWATSNKLYIKNLKINVVSSGFVTKATSYEASGTGSWRLMDENAGFKGLTKLAPSEHVTPLFSFEGGTSVADNDLRECQSKSTAYMLHCTDGIRQLPQKDVMMTVSLELWSEASTTEPYMTITNVPIRLEMEDNPGHYQDSFTWQAGFLCTYYLVIGDVNDKHEITFTATLTPWEDISGELSTDLEK